MVRFEFIKQMVINTSVTTAQHFLCTFIRHDAIEHLTALSTLHKKQNLRPIQNNCTHYLNHFSIGQNQVT